MTELIRGAGGGGGGGKGGGGGGSTHVPTEAPDSLRSRAYARVIDLVSEGEIEGLVDGTRSIYLDDTPLQSAEGYNFNGVTVVTRTGTPAQDYIPGFAAVESEIAVSTEVKAATPVTRSISNTNVSAVRVTLSVPALSHQNASTGDLTGTSVAIALDINNNGGGWQEVKTDTISGKTTSRYQRSYRLDLPAPGPWQLRVRRITPDSTQANLRNQTWWDSYTEIIDAKLRYPNSALVAIQIDAAQFNRIPRRGYDIKGLRVRVPVNYDPATRSHSGVWDGTFKIAWTDNPAWCFYDLLTSERYGLGAYLDEVQIDKWALYEIGRYCDEMVPDGFGGTEPRFTCNLYLQTRQEAYTVIQQMAAIFRGMAWWSQGAITAVADMPADPVALFTEANVIDGVFTYSGSSLRQRHTVALVSWNDPADMYRQKVEYVEDAEGIRQWGVRETEIIAVGCASRGQAHRAGRWLLYTERMETETVSFRCGLEGALVYPGAVIRVQDASRAGVRFGGRVVSASASQVTLDAPVTIEAGKTYQLSVMLPDGSVETRNVATGAGSRTALDVSPAFSAAPLAASVWVLAASDLAPTTWRVVAASEVETGIVEITALSHRPEKYAAIEHNLVLEPVRTTLYGATAPQAPKNLAVSESLTLIGQGIVAARMSISWEAVPGATAYEVSWRLDGENPHTATVTAPLHDVQPVQPGTYAISVRAVDVLGRRSAAAQLTTSIHGKTAPPAAPQNLTISTIGGLAVLRWDAVPDLDVQVGGYIEFCHSPASSGAAWGTSTSIGDRRPGSDTVAVLPLLAGSYLAKAVDSSGIYSTGTATVTTDGATVLQYAALDALHEEDEFSGQHSGTARDGTAATPVLKLDGAAPLDTWGAADDVDGWDEWGGLTASGTYTFAGGFDFGGVRRVRVSKILTATVVNAMDRVDARTNPLDDWDDWDGTTGNEADATVWARSTNDDPSGSPVWGTWQRLDSAEFNCRALQFQARLESYQPGHNIHISALGATAEQLV